MRGIGVLCLGKRHLHQLPVVAIEVDTQRYKLTNSTVIDRAFGHTHSYNEGHRPVTTTQYSPRGHESHQARHSRVVRRLEQHHILGFVIVYGALSVAI